MGVIMRDMTPDNILNAFDSSMLLPRISRFPLIPIAAILITTVTVADDSAMMLISQCVRRNE